MEQHLTHGVDLDPTEEFDVEDGEMHGPNLAARIELGVTVTRVQLAELERIAVERGISVTAAAERMIEDGVQVHRLMLAERALRAPALRGRWVALRDLLRKPK